MARKLKLSKKTIKKMKQQGLNTTKVIVEAARRDRPPKDVRRLFKAMRWPKVWKLFR